MALDVSPRVPPHRSFPAGSVERYQSTSANESCGTGAIECQTSAARIRRMDTLFLPLTAEGVARAGGGVAEGARIPATALRAGIGVTLIAGFDDVRHVGGDQVGVDHERA
ncbi:hypothetical protein CA85_47770 [Allorhodopirellula solitaria]|uniref:Uncharacterized protein n=1 Tax=Allorhodopirellula solitaria TaxID=2527987 RepID=A0A5C5WZY1_9BACT|nr:hypothetical protein CA85_47770 [Allorhodopirellula solitaria]